MQRTAVVVGAGPVGCLAAIALAKQGWKVEVYEGRPDIRLPSSKAAAQQRSINLAISARGITALRAILDHASAEAFLDSVIPMRGRMIHSTDGKQQSQAYDRHGQCINSIDRALLNEDLLATCVATPGVRVLFRHKVQSINFEGRSMSLRDLDVGADVEVAFDLCIGADGSYSVVRRQLMRVVRMDYQQTYIPHEYMELKMPAGKGVDGEPTFLLDPNHLHIWPRHSFMLIALPNKDRTFTCTLFAPTDDFDRLSKLTADGQLAWFQAHFPDALDVIGADALLHDLARNPRSPLISIKANPYHYLDRALLLGDAAHSMVPFYGQGLNCGLEDVRIFDSILRRFKVTPAVDDETSDVKSSLADALEEYSRIRHADLVAICELAMNNYTEMRHDVTTPAYLLRRAVDDILYALTASPSPPSNPTSGLTYTDPAAGAPMRQRIGWLPLYTMVTFRPDIGYADARARATRQGAFVGAVGSALAALVGVGALGGVAWAARTLGWFGMRATRR